MDLSILGLAGFEQICPCCRSRLSVDGNVDIKAPYFQVIDCPICTQKIPVSRGIIPKRLERISILKAEKAPTSCPIRLKLPSGDVIESKSPMEVATDYWAKSGYADKIAETFKLGLGIQEPKNTGVFTDIGKSLQGIGIWVIIALVIIFLISRRV